MFGFFKKVKKEAINAGRRDLMQAVVAGSLLVAYADGECEDSEITKMNNIISATPELSAFGSELSKTISEYRRQLDADFQVGKLRMRRELRDIDASEDDKALVFTIMCAIARADGTIEKAEEKVLREVAADLGINTDDYDVNGTEDEA